MMEPDVLMQMAHSPVRNYAVPGLTSWLIGQPHSGGGCVRLFVSEREQQRDVTPHSHRFNFECLVLTGVVRNRIWTRSDSSGDLFFEANQVAGRMGGYDVCQFTAPARYDYLDEVHTAGQWYGMEHDAIHSIFFGRDTRVLFFEGPEVASTTRILEPCVNGCRIQTLTTEPWMFK